MRWPSGSFPSLATLPADRSHRGPGDWRRTATPLADYLATRVVELVVHADDLAASVGETIELPPAAAGVAFGVLLHLARANAGDLAVAAGLHPGQSAPPLGCCGSSDSGGRAGGSGAAPDLGHREHPGAVRGGIAPEPPRAPRPAS